ncbi:unnamed protein product [Phytophthora lilii]|uniref:Unnamed protein product n=1 Tax=Phytophthora lilii TaxID=2077276 RepID=A0A9W6UEK7_9STRA|nr:unnamed protein product [Phytophthora lilii]
MFGPESVFIPGLLRVRDNVQAEDVAPWKVREIRQVTIQSLTPSQVAELRTPGWMFPAKGSVRTLSESDLMPLTYNPDQMPGVEGSLDAYFDHEEALLQMYWELTHKLPITGRMQQQVPGLARHYHACKNRKSHAMEKRRAITAEILNEARRSGRFDLDLMLDPAVLQVPQAVEDCTWYPGSEAIAEGRDPPTSLWDALHECDAAQSWRNHFRTTIHEHSFYQVPRLRGKFIRTRTSESLL